MRANAFYLMLRYNESFGLFFEFLYDTGNQRTYITTVLENIIFFFLKKRNRRIHVRNILRQFKKKNVCLDTVRYGTIT